MLVVLVMTPLDASATNIINPILQGVFHLSLTHVAWVTLAYLLVLSSLILPMGRLGDLFGFRRLYLLGTALFVLASIGCGLAPGFGWLVAGRVLQALGACMLMSLSSGITTALFPANERGRALGVVGMAVAIGLVLGPTVGGLLTYCVGWRWIFFINLPIGLVGGLLCYRMLPAFSPGKATRVDWPGTLLAMCTLGSVVMALTQGEHWGWCSVSVLGLAVIGVAAGIGFVLVESRVSTPMLDLSLFRNPVFTGANVGLIMNYLGQFCATFLVPKLLIDALRLTSAQAGMVMIGLPLAVLVIAPLSGALSDRVGTRLLTTVGESLVALGLVGLAFSAPSQHLVLIIACMLLVGVGAGLFQATNNSAIMGCVPRSQLGVGGGMLATMRNVGMAMGITVSSVVATAGRQHYLLAHPTASTTALLHGISWAFFIGAAFAALGALTSAVRADHRPPTSPTSA